MLPAKAGPTGARDMNTIGEWAGAVSVLLGALALLGTYRSWRKRELRRDDVLAWGSEAIAALQSLLLICLDEEHGTGASNPRLEWIRFNSSILVERGRLFFRNADPEAKGAWKERAYRGYRPCILDHLVTAHQIASAWPAAKGLDRTRMRMVAEDCVRSFVSLLQEAVGRDRTASADTSRGGQGADLDQLMAQLDSHRVETGGQRS
jgi:hypothetical protein